MAIAASDVLTTAITEWATRLRPVDERIVRRAAAEAERAYAAGANVDEACQRARSLIESWLRHPANSAAAPD